MQIHNQSPTGATGAAAARAQVTQRSGQTGASESSRSAPSGDRVEFSSALGSLARAISTDSVGRANRVQALASQYQSGSYKVDSAATSLAMVTDALSAEASPSG
jgi:anti-sigma28 factor (negative regulator of flagellin synthesis)